MHRSGPTFADLFRAFGHVGLWSFGGPAAQIALMHKTLVEERAWLSEAAFLRALSFCMLLPGPEAMQLATYAGWRLKGVAGGLLAGLLFVLPGACVIAGLAAAYAAFGTAPQTQALLLGVKAVVIVIVAQALVRLARKALNSRSDLAIASASFGALFVLGLPFPVVILAAATWGWMRSTGSATPSAQPPGPANGLSPAALLAWAVLWLAPLPLLSLTGQSLLFELARFFATLAVVSFGGAYAVLAYMAQEVVQQRGWLTPEQMIDALGLAETTPGPLILVTQFVGQLTGHIAQGWAFGLAAGAVTLWMTFVPCFLWIFAFAPHVEALLARPRLQSALGAITAAVVGVIANLSLWFALHVFFGEIRDVPGLGARVLPAPASLVWQAVVLTSLAAVLLGPLRRGIPLTLLIGAATSWALAQL